MYRQGHPLCILKSNAVGTRFSVVGVSVADHAHPPDAPDQPCETLGTLDGVPVPIYRSRRRRVRGRHTSRRSKLFYIDAPRRSLQGSISRR